MQASTVFPRLRWFFTRKWTIWSIIILVIVGGILYFVFGRSTSPTNIQTDKVTQQNIEKTVLTTGEVVSSTDLSLGFQTSGVVSQLRVNEGDMVKAGQVLAVLDQGNAYASLKTAQGTLAQAQANYDKVSAAATVQDIAVSQAAVNTAATTLLNTKQSLNQELFLAYNNATAAVLSNTNNLFSNPQSETPLFSIPGTAQNSQTLAVSVGNQRAAINAQFVTWQNEVSSVSDLTVETVVTDSLKNLNAIHNLLADLLSLVTTYSQATTSSGQTALTSAQTALTTAKVTVDTTTTTLTADVQALRNAQSALDQARASLALKQAPARPEDTAAAAAQVASAQGQVATAQVALDHTIIKAPADGTVTKVDIKLGEQAQVGAEVIRLQNVNSLHAEADVSEADIVPVAIGQTIDYTFDALGPNRHFSGTVLTVNPASTVISGVVNYKVTGALDNIPDIKPGMTANMTILVAQKENALVVPSSAVINQDNKRFVRVIDDTVKKTYHQVEVTTGLEADAGLTEILSGLTDGQEVVTFIK